MYYLNNHPVNIRATEAPYTVSTGAVFYFKGVMVCEHYRQSKDTDFLTASLAKSKVFIWSQDRWQPVPPADI
ncbi:hypothetical protein NV379_25625 [Paenibacillus sp. N1-5-1-14]|uniref:hypothetical protein n=1 Tax=Paenibacillus radicibacter TaxID=2972488 RepID=UPI00215982AC|nr:hypothetical protein [Paenibacillus radicibacter]MCR8646006.1 hypothetical protein [Paenibacillus radicibacter]